MKTKRTDLRVAELVAEKIADLDLLGEEQTEETFTARTLLALIRKDKDDINFICSEILEPLYNIDYKTDFEREIIWEVEERLPYTEHQQALYDIIKQKGIDDPISHLQGLDSCLGYMYNNNEVDKTTICLVQSFLQYLVDCLNKHLDIEFNYDGTL